MTIKHKYFLFLVPFLLFMLAGMGPTQLVRVGVYDNPPLSFVDEEGIAQGFVVDLLREIAKEEGWELEYIPCEWDDCLGKLEDGENDLLGPIAFSEERFKRFDFSDETLITNWGQVYVRSNAPDTSILDLDGKKIAAVEKDIHTVELKSYLLSFGFSVDFVYVESYDEVMQMINDKEVFGGIVNHLYAMQYGGDYDAIQSAIIFNPIEVRFAARKGSYSDLLSALDVQLSLMKADQKSSYYQALNLWLHNPVGWIMPLWAKWLSASLFVVILSLVFGAFFLRSQVRKRTTALAESEFKHRSLVDNALVGFYITQENTIRFASAGLAKLFGYDSAEILIGRNVRELVAPQSWDKVDENIQKREASTTKISSYRFQGLRKDGDIVDIEVLGARIQYEGKTAIQGVLLDITGKVRAEERFERLSEASLEAIFISEKGICLEANLASEKLFGYSQKEVVGMAATDIFAIEDRDIVIHHILSGYDKPYRVTALRKDGTTFDAEINGRIMRYEGRAVRVTSIRDIREQVQVEAALLESEKKYRHIFENATEGIFQSTLDGRFLRANPAAAKIYGYESPEDMTNEITNISKQIYVNSSSRNDFLDDLQGSFEALTFRKENYRKDGSVIWVQTKAQAVYDDNGEILYIEGFLEDITEQVKAEELLQKSEERYRIFFENNDAIIILVNPKNGEIVFVNDAALDFYGYAKEKIIGMNINEINTLSSEKIKTKMADAIKRKKNYFNFQHMLSSGEIRDVEIYETKLELNEQELFSLIIHDITERKEAEEKLRKSKERFENVIAQAPIPMAITLNDGSIEYINREFVKVFGYTLDDFSEPKRWWHAIYPDEKYRAHAKKEWEKGILEYAEADEPIKKQIRKVARKDGDVRIVELDMTPLGDISIIAMNDITEFSNAQRELKINIDQLISQNRISTALSTSLNLENVLEIILKEAALSIQFDAAAVFLKEENGDVTVSKVTEDAQKITGKTFLIEDTGLQNVGSKPFILDDASSSPLFSKWDNQDTEIRGWMVLPLIVRENVLGYLTFDSYQPQAFSSEDASIAQSFAPHAAQAIYNARLHEKIQQNLQKLETLNTVTTALSTSLDLENVLALILEQLRSVVLLDSATIFLLEENSQLAVVADYGFSPPIKGFSNAVIDKLFEKVQESKKPLIIDNPHEHPHFKNLGESHNLKSWVGIPLIQRDLLIGFLTLDSGQEKAYSPKELEALKPFVAQAAQAITNARLYEQVIADTNEVEKRVQERTEELQKFVSLTADREIRMAELKKVIAKLRTQLIENDQVPIADDPLRQPKQ